MCGIAAIFGPGASGDVSLAAGKAAAMDSLARRGPDGRGEWSCARTGEAWMGHLRLAVVDLSSGGAQPMATPDARFALVYNGEIYNAAALRSELKHAGASFASTSDTEVLLHALRTWGVRDAIERLRGMFAFALWDARTRTVHAAVDHAGMKPLYWAVEGGRLFVASTVDTVRALGATARGVDPVSVSHVLCHGYIPPPSSIWRGVFRLAPGTAMSWRVGDENPSVWRHWEPPTETRGSGTPWESIWEPVVRDHFESDVPVGLLLSSGLDSTAVALGSVRSGRRPKCVTLGLSGMDDESPAAARTAAAMGLEHASAEVDGSDVPGLIARAAEAFDEPQAYGALLTMTAVAGAARERAKVFLSGDGGDEALAGYTWHREPPPAAGARDTHAQQRAAERVALAEATGAERTVALDLLAKTSPLHAYAQRVHPLFHPAEAAALSGAAYGDDAYLAHLRESARPGLPWPRRAQAMDLMTFCAGSILPKVDRASMHVGLEVRCPFLDRRVLEWSLGRPREPEGAPPKSVIRAYLRAHVPGEVLTAPKRGFSLRTDWSAHEGTLRAGIAASRLVGDGVVRADWDRFCSPDAPYARRRVFALAMLAAWYERRRA